MKQSKSNKNKKNIIIIDNYFLEMQYKQQIINKCLAILLTGIMFENTIFTIFLEKYKIYIDNSHKVAIYKKGNNSTPKLTFDMIKDCIDNNKNLQDKQIILNEDLINYSLNYINKEENDWWRGILYYSLLPKFDIVYQDLQDINALGAWNLIENRISIDKEKTLNYNDVFNHEFLHLVSPPNKYRFFTEAYTEILSNEFQTSLKYNYQDDSFVRTKLEKNFSSNYLHEQYYTRVLMDIIGSEPLSQYYFSGDINYIIKELEPYLSDSEINLLLKSFKYNISDVNSLITKEAFNNNLSNIENLLSKVYYEKYHQKLTDAYFDKLDFSVDDLGGIPFTGYFNIKINDYITNYKNVEIEKSKDICDIELSGFPFYFDKPICDYDVDFQELVKNGREPFEVLAWFENLCLLNVCLENKRMTDEEKNFLFNSNYINDLEYYHKLYQDCYNNVYNLDILYNYLCNLEIDDDLPLSSYMKSVGTNIYVNKKMCYYYSKANNLLYGDVYNKFLAECFVYNLSFSKEYKVLNNGCNKIILKEYYGIELEKESKYSKIEEKITKILMDLVGSDYIKVYIITGNTDLLKQKLMDSLNEEEAILLINCLSNPLNSKTDNYDTVIDNLNSLFNKLQYNLYGTYGSNNYINDYEINDKYYFNTKYLNMLENNDIFLMEEAKKLLLKLDN